LGSTPSTSAGSSTAVPHHEGDDLLWSAFGKPQPSLGVERPTEPSERTQSVPARMTMDKAPSSQKDKGQNKAAADSLGVRFLFLLLLIGFVHVVWGAVLEPSGRTRPVPEEAGEADEAGARGKRIRVQRGAGHLARKGQTAHPRGPGPSCTATHRARSDVLLLCIAAVPSWQRWRWRRRRRRWWWWWTSHGGARHHDGRSGGAATFRRQPVHQIFITYHAWQPAIR